MEPQLLQDDYLAIGNVRYQFRAFHIQGNGASFNFRIVTFQQDQEPDFRSHNRQDFSFWFPLGDFRGSASRRQQMVHGMMSSMTSLGDSETLEFWKDHVSNYSCPFALMRFLHYNSLHRVSGGAVKFDIEFHVYVAPVLLRQATFFVGERVYNVTDEQRTRPSRASTKAAIKNLERLKYGDGAQFREKECTICLIDFESKGKDLIRIPCSHTFHYRCLTQWLKRSLSCPLCRYKINVSVAEGGNRMIS